LIAQVFAHKDALEDDCMPNSKTSLLRVIYAAFIHATAPERAPFKDFCAQPGTWLDVLFARDKILRLDVQLNRKSATAISTAHTRIHIFNFISA
jgi:hypothetical protein